MSNGRGRIVVGVGGWSFPGWRGPFYPAGLAQKRELAYAAEHLEIQTADAARVADRIRNAGAIFVGAYSPVSLGDYCAGSNHVLPTSGTASFASGLNVTTFLKIVQLVHYDRDALREVSGSILSLAEAENLPAHGEAVSARFPADGVV